MYRSAFASALTLLLSIPLATAAFAQATPAATSGATSPAPARAKFATPIKGEAVVQVIAGPSKPVGKEIVTTYKIKNVAAGPIAMLKIDEYWYDKGGKLVSTAEERYRQPFRPGDIVEITTRAPANPGALNKRAIMSHANGKITAKPVKSFE